jgi:DNA-binding XRE family transcriptional regulator
MAETAETPAPPKPRINADEVNAAIKAFDGTEISTKIAALRDELRIEVDELAEKTGITKQRIGAIEKDASTATLEELHKFAAAFTYTTGGMVRRILK